MKSYDVEWSEIRRVKVKAECCAKTPGQAISMASKGILSEEELIQSKILEAFEFTALEITE
jgi:hypothetical protein